MLEGYYTLWHHLQQAKNEPLVVGYVDLDYVGAWVTKDPLQAMIQQLVELSMTEANYMVVLEATKEAQ